MSGCGTVRYIWGRKAAPTPTQGPTAAATLTQRRESPDIEAALLPHGARLRRFYGEEWHEVEVIPSWQKLARLRRRDREAAVRNGWWRYKYRGRRYKSLSAVARIITGDPTMSGNRFFGLRRRRG